MVERSRCALYGALLIIKREAGAFHGSREDPPALPPASVAGCKMTRSEGFTQPQFFG